VAQQPPDDNYAAGRPTLAEWVAEHAPTYGQNDTYLFEELPVEILERYARYEGGEWVDYDMARMSSDLMVFADSYRNDPLSAWANTIATGGELPSENTLALVELWDLLRRMDGAEQLIEAMDWNEDGIVSAAEMSLFLDHRAPPEFREANPVVEELLGQGLDYHELVEALAESLHDQAAGTDYDDWYDAIRGQAPGDVGAAVEDAAAGDYLSLDEVYALVLSPDGPDELLALIGIEATEDDYFAAVMHYEATGEVPPLLQAFATAWGDLVPPAFITRYDRDGDGQLNFDELRYFGVELSLAPGYGEWATWVESGSAYEGGYLSYASIYNLAVASENTMTVVTFPDGFLPREFAEAYGHLLEDEDGIFMLLRQVREQADSPEALEALVQDRIDDGDELLVLSAEGAYELYTWNNRDEIIMNIREALEMPLAPDDAVAERLGMDLPLTPDGVLVAASRMLPPEVLARYDGNGDGYLALHEVRLFQYETAVYWEDFADWESGLENPATYSLWDNGHLTTETLFAIARIGDWNYILQDGEQHFPPEALPPAVVAAYGWPPDARFWDDVTAMPSSAQWMAHMEELAVEGDEAQPNALNGFYGEVRAYLHEATMNADTDIEYDSAAFAQWMEANAPPAIVAYYGAPFDEWGSAQRDAFARDLYATGNAESWAASIHAGTPVAAEPISPYELHSLVEQGGANKWEVYWTVVSRGPAEVEYFYRMDNTFTLASASEVHSDITGYYEEYSDWWNAVQQGSAGMPPAQESGLTLQEFHQVLIHDYPALLAMADANGDGQISANELQAWVNAYAPPELARFDLDGDGTFNGNDVEKLVNGMLMTSQDAWVSAVESGGEEPILPTKMSMEEFFHFEPYRMGTGLEPPLAFGLISGVNRMPPELAERYGLDPSGLLDAAVFRQALEDRDGFRDSAYGDATSQYHAWLTAMEAPLSEPDGTGSNLAGMLEDSVASREDVFGELTAASIDDLLRRPDRANDEGDEQSSLPGGLSAIPRDELAEAGGTTSSTDGEDLVSLGSVFPGNQPSESPPPDDSEPGEDENFPDSM
jgi:Ca2+-binding EF-hand superfamily protein